jgi:hypothetical protein
MKNLAQKIANPASDTEPMTMPAIAKPPPEPRGVGVGD